MPTDNQQHEPSTACERPPSRDVAGTVLRAARLSAGLSSSRLAALADLAEPTILAWENGSSPLASVPVPQLQIVKDALTSAGAQDRLLADLDPAMWCDIIVAALAGGEDVSCLLADPLAADPAFTELLGWSSPEVPPARYRRFTPAAGLRLP